MHVIWRFLCTSNLSQIRPICKAISINVKYFNIQNTGLLQPYVETGWEQHNKIPAQIHSWFMNIYHIILHFEISDITGLTWNGAMDPFPRLWHLAWGWEHLCPSLSWLAQPYQSPTFYLPLNLKFKSITK